MLNSTMYYAFPYMEAQNCVSANNSHSCSFPNGVMFKDYLVRPMQFVALLKNYLLVYVQIYFLILMN